MMFGKRNKKSATLGVCVTPNNLHAVLLKTSDDSFEVVRAFTKERGASANNEGAAEFDFGSGGEALGTLEGDAGEDNFTIQFGSESSLPANDMFLSSEFQGSDTPAGGDFEFGAQAANNNNRTSAPFARELQDIIESCHDLGFEKPKVSFCLSYPDIKFFELNPADNADDSKKTLFGNLGKSKQADKPNPEELHAWIMKHMDQTVAKERTAMVLMKKQDDDSRRLIGIAVEENEPAVPSLEMVIEEAGPRTFQPGVIDAEVSIYVGIVRQILAVRKVRAEELKNAEADSDASSPKDNSTAGDNLANDKPDDKSDWAPQNSGGNAAGDFDLAFMSSEGFSDNMDRAFEDDFESNFVDPLAGNPAGETTNNPPNAPINDAEAFASSFADSFTNSFDGNAAPKPEFVHPASDPATGPENPQSEINLLVRVGAEDTFVLFMQNDEVLAAEQLHSLTAFDPPETICSRVMLQQDERGYGEVQNVFIAAEKHRNELAGRFQEFYPFSKVSTVTDGLAEIGIEFNNEIDADPTHGVGLAIATALRSMLPAGVSLFNDVDLMPKHIIHQTAPLSLSWHTISMIAVLFITVLGLTGLYFVEHQKVTAVEQRLATYNGDARLTSRQLEVRIDSLDQVVRQYGKALTVIDSLLVGSDKWTRTLESTSRHAASVAGVWIEGWQPRGNEILLQGNATTRERVVRYAERLDASIESLSFSEIREWPVFQFVMVVPVSNDLPKVATWLRTQTEQNQAEQNQSQNQGGN